ncbi:hypothetical protein WJX84_011210 [Apatococcus fuscideae]|uniref:URB1 C-terminal domain-containing protein n=1 Tax=Apatococcus fuscideae TaxID=2026836 RepID=A0AAW1T4M7_9CHLO
MSSQLREARQRMLECLLRLRVTEACACRCSEIPLEVISSRICPKCLSKSQLSHGLQHSSRLVRYATLCLLSCIMRAFQSALMVLRQQAISGGAEAADQLCRSLRQHLPDVQTLIAMHTSLESLPKAEPATEESDKDEGAALAGDQPEGHLLSDKELLLVRLLDVLAGYQRCLPETTGASAYEPLRFLPQDPSELSPWTEAVLGFLSEAAAAVARRPDQLWETQMTMSEGSPAYEVHGLGGHGPGQSGQSFSLLAVSALQQSIKVAGSSKRPSFSRAAVCSYVAGALAALIDIQADPVPSSVASPRGSKQKRKRESKAPPELSGIEPASNSASIEVGLQKKLRLNPSVEIRCIEGRWTTELQELADSIASTGADCRSLLDLLSEPCLNTRGLDDQPMHGLWQERVQVASARQLVLFLKQLLGCFGTGLPASAAIWTSQAMASAFQGLFKISEPMAQHFLASAFVYHPFALSTFSSQAESSSKPSACLAAVSEMEQLAWIDLVKSILPLSQPPAHEHLIWPPTLRRAGTSSMSSLDQLLTRASEAFKQLSVTNITSDEEATIIAYAMSAWTGFLPAEQLAEVTKAAVAAVKQRVGQLGTGTSEAHANASGSVHLLPQLPSWLLYSFSHLAPALLHSLPAGQLESLAESAKCSVPILPRTDAHHMAGANFISSTHHDAQPEGLRQAANINKDENDHCQTQHARGEQVAGVACQALALAVKLLGSTESKPMEAMLHAILCDPKIGRPELARLLKDEEVEVVVRYCFKHVTSEGSHILGALVQHCPACLRIYAKIAVFALQQCRVQADGFSKLCWLLPGLAAYLTHAAKAPATPIWPVDLEDEGEEMAENFPVSLPSPSMLLEACFDSTDFTVWNGDGLGALNFIDTGRIAHLLHEQLTNWLLQGCADNSCKSFETMAKDFLELQRLCVAAAPNRYTSSSLKEHLAFHMTRYSPLDGGLGKPPDFSKTAPRHERDLRLDGWPILYAQAFTQMTQQMLTGPAANNHLRDVLKTWAAALPDRRRAKAARLLVKLWNIESVLMLCCQTLQLAFKKSSQAVPQAAEVEQVYLASLESAIGDGLAELLPELPDLARMDTFNSSNLMRHLDDISTQILRTRLDRPSCIRSLRRLLAALLPVDPCTEADSCEKQAVPKMSVSFGPAPTPEAPWSTAMCHYANELEELRRRREEIGNIYGADCSDDFDMALDDVGSDDEGPTTEQMLARADRRHHDRYAELTDDDESRSDDADQDPGVSGDSVGMEGNAAVAKLAGELLQRLAGHSKIGPVLLADAAQAGLPCLSREIAAMPLPVASLLPLADVRPMLPSSQAKAVGSIRQELAELAATLAELIEAHADASASSTALMNDLQPACSSLMQLLLMCYGASLTPSDKAILQAILALNRLTHYTDQLATDSDSDADAGSDSDDQAGAKFDKRASSGMDESASGVEALQGLLPQTGLLWGRVAQAAFASGNLLQTDGNNPTTVLLQRQQLLQLKQGIQAKRCAISAIHFPEARSSNGADSLPDDRAELVPVAACHEAGYDPVFMVPFMLQGLRTGLLSLESAAACGLLALCLRTTAAADADLRSAAAICAKLYLHRLGQLHPSDPDSFPAAASLLSLLNLVCPALEAATDGQLPATLAVFAAEAATLLQHPKHPISKTLQKLLVRKRDLSLEEVPFMDMFLEAGGQQHARQQLWILRLLSVSLRNPGDASIFRKRFVIERLTALHGSPLIPASSCALIRATVAGCIHVPPYATDLVCRAGLIPWLTAQAEAQLLSACKCPVTPSSHSKAASSASVQHTWEMSSQRAHGAEISLEGSTMEAAAQPGGALAVLSGLLEPCLRHAQAELPQAEATILQAFGASSRALCTALADTTNSRPIPSDQWTHIVSFASTVQQSIGRFTTVAAAAAASTPNRPTTAGLADEPVMSFTGLCSKPLRREQQATIMDWRLAAQALLDDG